MLVCCCVPPIVIAATSYEPRHIDIGSGAIFSAILAKPIVKKNLSDCFKNLGFVLGTAGGEKGGARGATGGITVTVPTTSGVSVEGGPKLDSPMAIESSI